MRKNGKWEEKNEKKLKRKEENVRNLRGKRTEKRLRAFSAETFSGFTKLEISTWKRLKSHREKIGKSDLAPPPEKFSCYAPVYQDDMMADYCDMMRFISIK